MESGRNVAVVREIFERAWNRADFDGLEDVFGESVSFHFRRSERATDVGDLKQLVGTWRQAFPDMCFVMEELVADGDFVVARLTHSGTHQGVWKGLAATGRRFEIDVMFFFRFEAGKLVEIWEVADEYAMWEQLGRFT